MAITTYSELQSAVTARLIIDYGATLIQEFIALGEAMLNRRLRIREMETSADLTLVAGTRTVALPTRYVEMRRIYLDGSPVRKLNFIPATDFWLRYMATETSKPAAYTIEADNIVFGPTPDTAYTGKMLYYQKFAALSDAAPTNNLLTNHPDVYLYAAELQGWFYKGDFTQEGKEAISACVAALDRTIEEMLVSDRRDRHSGDVLVARSDVGNPPRLR